MGKIVNQTELAELLGVSDVSIWEWQKDGLPIEKRGVRGSANTYDVAAVVEWRIQRALAKAGKGESQRDREARLRGDMLEIELEEKRKVLVSAIDVEPMWTMRVMAAAAYQLSRHSRLATVLEVAPGVEAKRAVLKKEDQEFLERLGVNGAEMHRQIQELLDKQLKADADEFLRKIASIGHHPVEPPAGGVAAADPAAQNPAV